MKANTQFIIQHTKNEINMIYNTLKRLSVYCNTLKRTTVTLKNEKKTIWKIYSYKGNILWVNDNNINKQKLLLQKLQIPLIKNYNESTNTYTYLQNYLNHIDTIPTYFLKTIKRITKNEFINICNSIASEIRLTETKYVISLKTTSLEISSNYIQKIKPIINNNDNIIEETIPEAMAWIKKREEHNIKQLNPDSPLTINDKSNIKSYIKENNQDHTTLKTLLTNKQITINEIATQNKTERTTVLEDIAFHLKMRSITVASTTPMPRALIEYDAQKLKTFQNHYRIILISNNPKTIQQITKECSHLEISLEIIQETIPQTIKKIHTITEAQSRIILIDCEGNNLMKPKEIRGIIEDSLLVYNIEEDNIVNKVKDKFSKSTEMKIKKPIKIKQLIDLILQN